MITTRLNMYFATRQSYTLQFFFLCFRFLQVLTALEVPPPYNAHGTKISKVPSSFKM